MALQHCLLTNLHPTNQTSKTTTKRNGANREELADKATRLGLPCYMVADAGRTQIESGSITVLAVGPGSVSEVNQVTGNLKLL